MKAYQLTIDMSGSGRAAVQQGGSKALAQAVKALQAGQIICLYDADGREEETDMVIASQFATPEAIRQLRMDAGGLLCTTVAPEHHQTLGLPFAADLLDQGGARHPVLAGMKAHDLRYDASKSSFGITINARTTFTGIPDGDRSLTIRTLASFLAELPVQEAHSSATKPAAPKAPSGVNIVDNSPQIAQDREAQDRFGATFRTPGHVILLNGSPGGLATRQGHTELSTELMRLAGLVPSASICEMLDGTTGKALDKAGAQAYAKANGLVFLTGADVMAAWQERLSAPRSAAPKTPRPTPEAVAKATAAPVPAPLRGPATPKPKGKVATFA